MEGEECNERWEDFRSLFMVASCAGAALGCYLVSLRVASERAAVENVETKIVLAQRDLRMLQTEIGTRGRLAQLERWNASVLAMSAPSADQFLNGSFELAELTQPERKVDFQAPVVLASAPAPRPEKPPIGEAGDRRCRCADGGGAGEHCFIRLVMKTETREVPAKPAAEMPPAAGSKSAERPATAAKPAPKFPDELQAVDKPGLAAAQPVPKKSVDKPVIAGG